MIKKSLSFSFCFFYFSILNADVESKIIAFYQIQDYASALNLIENQPKQDGFLNLKLEILSKLGLTQEALSGIKLIPSIYDVSKKENFLTLESLAWSILNDPKNMSESVQVAALTGAYLTRDAKAALLLKKNLYSTNSRLRAMAANFASQYQDPFLKEAVFARLKEEKNIEVKKELITALGKMRMKEAIPYLEGILLSSSTTDELKAQAILTYVEIYDQLNFHQVQFFIHSNRTHLKLLGLRLLQAFENIPQQIIPEIIQLLKDASPEVKQEALVTVGLLFQEVEFPTEMIESIKSLIDHTHPYVKMLSLWVQSRIDKRLDPQLTEFINHPSQQIRNFAISLLTTLGNLSNRILLSALDHQDPYVRINAALGLIKIDKKIKKAVVILEKELKNSQLFMMIDESIHPNFSMVMPSKIKHHPFIQAYPKIVDGMARLKILEFIAIKNSKKIKDHLRNLLSEKEAILTFYTMSLLMQEDLENFEELKELTQDADSSIAMAATIALAFIGKDPAIAHRLVQLFDRVGFEEKLHILEALGALGNKEMIPFLVSMMQKPFSSLQIVSASALIQCLYH